MTIKRTVPTVIDATSLKMSLGSIGERVRTHDLQITKHGTPQAIVISVDRYQQLTRLEPVDPSSLEALQKEFDDKFARMQLAPQAVAMNRLMDADEDDVNRFLNQHYDRNPVPPMADSVDATALGTQRTSRLKPGKALTIVTAPLSTAKNAVPPTFITIESRPSKAGLSLSGVLRHDKSGRILSVTGVATKATKRKKPSK